MAKIKVRLNDLVAAFHNGGQARFFLDNKTGEVLMDFEGAMYNERGDSIRHLLEEQPERFIEISSIGMRETLRMVNDFIRSEESGTVKDALERALATSRPLQNFRNALNDVPAARRRWYKFEQDRIEQMARQWLLDNKVNAKLVLPKPIKGAEPESA
jgi:hypothetical protein